MKLETNFFDENGQEIDIDNYEPMERKLSEIHIMEDDCVLELGARYGTVSVTINKKLKNKKNQVVVEPDSRVWDALEKNKKNHNCEFNIVRGFISNKKLNLTNLESGSGSTYIEDQNSIITSFSIDEVKKKYNIDKFNVLFADCEGGLEIFLDENPNLYDDLRLVIYEYDYPDKCNYAKIDSNLQNKGFNKIYYHEIFQVVWIR
jgi:FkbM family methyltransferase